MDIARKKELRSRGRLAGFFLLSSLVFGFPEPCWSQVARKPSKLFTRSAEARAQERSADKTSILPAVTLGALQLNYPEQAAEGTADASSRPPHEFMPDVQRDRVFRADYRWAAQTAALAAESSRRTSDLNEIYEEDEIAAVSQGLFAYQGTLLATELVTHSELEPLYRETVRRVKAAANYVTLSIERDGSGELAFHHGQSRPEKKVVEFKLDVSTHEGITSRVKFGGDFSLRFDPLDHAATFEIERNF